MSDCLVLIGIDGCGKDEFCKEYMKKYDYKHYQVIYMKDILIQLYGKNLHRNLKIERELFLNKIEQKLLQGRNIIVYDGDITMSGRKSLLTCVGKIEDARISCVDFITPVEECEKYSSKSRNQLTIDNLTFAHPTIEEGWHGIMRFDRRNI